MEKNVEKLAIMNADLALKCLEIGDIVNKKNKFVSKKNYEAAANERAKELTCREEAAAIVKKMKSVRKKINPKPLNNGKL